jgi:Rieske Fe-S protein
VPGRTVSRRTLLRAGGTALCARALGCGPDPEELPAVIPAGQAADVAQGTLRAVPGFPVAVGRDSLGIFALSLLCTHAGCDIAQDGVVSTGGIQCFCHGSVFDGQGMPLRGPASIPLPHLLVTSDAAGLLTIHGDQVTSPSTRLTG